MRIDTMTLIFIFSCVAFLVCGLGVILGVTSHWMKKIHTDLLSQFALLHSLFLLDKHEKKGCGCHGEEHNN